MHDAGTDERMEDKWKYDEKRDGCVYQTTLLYNTSSNELIETSHTNAFKCTKLIVPIHPPLFNAVITDYEFTIEQRQETKKMVKKNQ